MRILMLGAASIALAAASAGYADPGKGGGGGGGHGNGGGHGPAAVGPGNGGDKGHGQGNGNGGGGRSAGNAPARMDHASHGNGNGQGNSAMRGPERKTEQRTIAHEDRGNGNGNAKARAETVRHADRDVRQDVRQVREVAGGRRDDPRIVHTVARFDRRAAGGLIDGCPPGLAKKNNGCQPPGLARQDDDRGDRYYSPSWFGYPSVGDGRYYYDDGYLYRTSNAGSVLGYLPLLGGALSVGNPWPSYYQQAPVPDYYAQYYNLGSPDSYRYADDVLYRVNPQNDAITSIAALLTGDQFNIGQRMPAGYDVYNVPYEYRDQYYDTPESDYRYSDGYVYQVDPTTQLIQAAIQLLT